MRFTLGINLNTADVESLGIDFMLASALADVFTKVTSGHADAGSVYTDDGIRIGRWSTDDDGEFDLDQPGFALVRSRNDSADNARQFTVTTPEHTETDARPLIDDGITA
jgi:hypothetical protein